jgi:hypothetical protein
VNEKIILGGRTYRTVEDRTTLEQDHWIAGATRNAGSGDWKLRPGESAEAFGSRILSDLMASGKAFLILGGLLLPEDEKVWTPEIGYRTAAEVAALTDPEEKRRANAQLLSVVIGFFVSGLGSWMISGTSSEEGEPGKQTTEIDSESGGRSSGPSPGTTST